MTSPVRDGARLALGTLTVMPVRPPEHVDRRSGSWAMTLAPLVGLLLAVLAAAFIWCLEVGPASPLVAAALTIGLLALLTRAIHLDGLADTVDGLGSGRPPAQALDIMRKGDVGPFGVVTLVLVLLVQVAALAQHLAVGDGAVALLLALVVSRLVLAGVCSRRVPAARRDGLGRAVAGSVSRGQLAVATGAAVLALAATGLLLVLLPAAGPETSPDVGRVLDATLRGLLVAAVALGAGALMCVRCVRRLGGVTGDVMGACVEVTFTAALVVPTVL